MRHPATLCALTTSLLFLAAVPALAADEAAVFNQLYGDQLRQVSATRDVQDDLELAARLMVGAGSVGASPALQIIMYENAFDLGLGSAEGITASLESYDRLAELNPDSSATYRDRLLTAMRVQYARSRGEQKTALGQSYLATLLNAADELAAENPTEAARLARMAVPLAAEVDAAQVEHVRRKVEAMTALAVARNRARQLHDRLADNPSDTAAKALTELYLVDLDDPEQAAKIAPASGDVDLILMTSKAANDPAGATEDDSLAVADWYASLAREASPPWISHCP